MKISLDTLHTLATYGDTQAKFFLRNNPNIQVHAQNGRLTAIPRAPRVSQPTQKLFTPVKI